MSTTDTPPGGAPNAMLLRVEDAACLLGISRSLAYELAHLWLNTQGASGLPAVRLGRRLLIKRAAVEALARTDDGSR